MRTNIKRAGAVTGAALSMLFASAASDPGSGDWPMWGGRPTQHGRHHEGRAVSWDVQTKKNIKWVAQLGSQAYGNTVVSGGKVFVGTNNEALRDPKQTGDRAC